MVKTEVEPQQEQACSQRSFTAANPEDSGYNVWDYLIPGARQPRYDPRRRLPALANCLVGVAKTDTRMNDGVRKFGYLLYDDGQMFQVDIYVSYEQICDLHDIIEFIPNLDKRRIPTTKPARHFFRNCSTDEMGIALRHEEIKQYLVRLFKCWQIGASEKVHRVLGFSELQSSGLKRVIRQNFSQNKDAPIV